MSSVKLDLKQFKFVKSDGKSTTLQHKAGHQLTLAHNALSPEARGQLQALSKVSSQAQTPLQADSAKHQANQKMADGGQVADTAMPVDQFLAPKPVQPPAKEQQPYRPPVSKQTENKLRRHEHWGNVKRKFAPGGEVAEEDYTNKPDKGHGAIIFKAEGGDVDHECEGAKFCMHCGGEMRQQYAFGDEIQANPAEEAMRAANIQPDSSPNQEPEAPQDPEQIEKGNLYNKNLDEANTPVRERMAGFQPQPDPSRDFVNGKAPAEINPDVAEKTKAEWQGIQEQKKMQGVKNVQDAQKYNAGAAFLGAPQKPVPGAPPAQQSFGDQTPTTAPPPDMTPTPGQSQGDPLSAESLGRTVQGGIQAAKDMAPIQQKLGQEEAAAAQRKISLDMDNKQHYDNVVNDLEQERLHTVDDIRNGYINPEQYWTGHKDPQTGEMVGGHSKLMAGIGMILAGFNPTSNPNAAINMLKYQMDQNFQAQSKNLDSKHNLLKANLDHFRNAKDAADMTRLQISDITQAELLKAASTAKSASAKQAAMMAASSLANQAIPLSNTLYMRRAFTSLGQAGGSPEHEAAALGHMMVAAPEVYKEMQPKFVPGLGFADNPVSEDIRGQVRAHRNFDMSSQDLQSFMKQHPGILDHIVPGKLSPIQQIAQSKALAVQNAFRSGTLGGIYKAGEQPLLDKAVGGSPLDMASYFFNTEPRKLEELRGQNQRTFGVLQDSLGGSIAARHKQQMQQQAQQPQEQVKTVNGIKYKRGPKGEAIRVD